MSLRNLLKHRKVLQSRKQQSDTMAKAESWPIEKAIEENDKAIRQERRKRKPK